MRKLSYTFLFLVIPLTVVFSQRVDIDRLYFSVKSRRLPDKVLGPEYKTYSVNISSSLSVEVYTNQSFRDQVNIIGLKNVDGNAHLNVKVRLEDLMLESTSVKERVEVIKDKDGKETGRRYYYHAEVIYSFAATASVVDYKTNAPMSNYVLSRRDQKKAFNSSEYDSYKGASDYYNNNKLEIKTSLLREQINAALSSLSNSLNNEFGYPTDPDAPHIWYVDSKKHAEYQASQDACNKVKSVFAGVIPEDSLRGTKESLADAISYFEKLPSIYTDAEDKAQKKVRYMAFFNLATIYYYLDDPQTALGYAQKIIANDYDTGDGEKIQKTSNALIENFKKHKMTSRHFPIDLSNVEPPK
jgi:tetratricopeptide (TPR) repeat protein